MNELLELVAQMNEEQQSFLLQKAKEMLAEKNLTLSKEKARKSESKPIKKQ